MQSHLHSILEAVCNTFSGFIVALLYQYYVANPQLGHSEIDWGTTTWVTMQFTIISILRTYIWRRIWNRLTIKRIKYELAR